MMATVRASPTTPTTRSMDLVQTTMAAALPKWLPPMAHSTPTRTVPRTTHPGYGPQPGTVATFVFEGLGNGWTEGSMWFDMADFQASTFGAVNTTYNGIAQNWAFNDGFPSTKIRFFDLAQDVIDSINSLGSLTVAIDRAGSGDFYGFDFALLSDRVGDNTNVGEVPLPAAVWLFGSGVMGLLGLRRRKSAVAVA